MKIENDKKTGLLDNLVRSQNIKPFKEQGAYRAGNDGILDKVELSTRKDEVNRIKEKVKTEPAVNQEKVDRVREAIQSETYNVRGELVARGLLKSQILDEIL
jgi:flagellar biosynthesis anti-sigma factor FlgM